MFKGVVFDLDGTLIDSPLCFKLIRRELGIPENEYILEYLEKLPVHEKSAKFSLLEQIELDAAKKAVLFPGVQHVLSKLAEESIKIGIFTRNCRLATQHIVTSFGFSVDMVVTREDAPPKPDPTGLIKFSKDWGLHETELLFVGDYLFDINCGKVAGVKTALFTNGKILSEDWEPDFTIPHYSNFFDLIKNGCIEST